MGAPYAAVLFLFEHFTRRRIRLSFAISTLLLFAFLTAAAITEMEFEGFTINTFMLPQLLALLFGLTLSITTARPRSD